MFEAAMKVEDEERGEESKNKKTDLNGPYDIPISNQ
jgi:hypothetical protein